MQLLEALQQAFNWVVFPLLALVLYGAGLLAKKHLQNPPQPAPPVETGPQDAAHDKALQDAAKTRVQRLEEVRTEHRAAIRELTEEQRDRYNELVDNPDELNSWLKDVGRKQR